MISTNTQNKLPGRALTYLLIGRAILGLILIVIAIMMFSMGSIDGTQTINGVTSATSFSATIPAIILIVLGLLIPLWSIIWYSTFSYIVGDQAVTINSGVVLRQSRTIDFNKIQNIDNMRGPLQIMLGLTSVNIWTASQDQFKTSTIMVGNVPRTSTIAKPNGKLYLLRQDADDLKAYIAGKASIQNVQMVSPDTKQNFG